MGRISPVSCPESCRIKKIKLEIKRSSEVEGFRCSGFKVDLPCFLSRIKYDKKGSGLREKVQWGSVFETQGGSFLVQSQV